MRSERQLAVVAFVVLGPVVRLGNSVHCAQHVAYKKEEQGMGWQIFEIVAQSELVSLWRCKLCLDRRLACLKLEYPVGPPFCRLPCGHVVPTDHEFRRRDCALGKRQGWHSTAHLNLGVVF
jgi:hypothetical protein